MKLIIGNRNYSSWSLRGWLAARASGMRFEEIHVALDMPGSSERILAHCPTGKVPCLNDHGLLIWDSLAIGEYLADQQPALLPAARDARAVARSVIAEMHSGFVALRTHLPMNVRKDYRAHGHDHAADADIARVIALWKDCRARFGSGGPYLFGDFSLADAAYAPVCFRFRTYGVEPDGSAGDYLRTMLAHPLMQEWEAGARAETASMPAADLYG